jgi:hypothetical protein
MLLLTMQGRLQPRSEEKVGWVNHPCVASFPEWANWEASGTESVFGNTIHGHGGKKDRNRGWWWLTKETTRSYTFEY